MDCSLNSEGLDTPCGLSYLCCLSRGQERPLSLTLSLSLSISYSLSFPIPYSFSVTSLSHPFPHSVLHPASGVGSGATDSGGGGGSGQHSYIILQSPKSVEEASYISLSLIPSGSQMPGLVSSGVGVRGRAPESTEEVSGNI